MDYLEVLRKIKSNKLLTEYFKTVTGKEIACATEADIREFVASQEVPLEEPKVSSILQPREIPRFDLRISDSSFGPIGSSHRRGDSQGARL